jgi:predicted helicase
MWPACREDRIILACRCWDDFHASVGRIENETEKGDVFERLTQLFLETGATYSTQLETVWRRIEIPREIGSRRSVRAVAGCDHFCRARSLFRNS